MSAWPSEGHTVIRILPGHKGDPRVAQGAYAVVEFENYQYVCCTLQDGTSLFVAKSRCKPSSWEAARRALAKKPASKKSTTPKARSEAIDPRHGEELTVFDALGIPEPQ